MRGVGRGRGCGTKKNSSSGMEDRQSEKTTGPDPLPEGTMAAKVGVPEPVVRQKVNTVRVVSQELSESDIFEEIRVYATV